jgi:4-hydroxy-2-oxoheptanedioate aldolase
VAAARYAQKPGAPDFAPQGKRGYSPAVPARYRGLHPDDYAELSDIWGLDPRGELLLIFIIESKAGVDNVREIAGALTEAGVRCILWAGGGDMSLSYGEPVYGGAQPATFAGIDEVLAAGREFGSPVRMNGPRQAAADYARGARAFFSIGPAGLGGSPMSAETRAALGR